MIAQQWISERPDADGNVDERAQVVRLRDMEPNGLVASNSDRATVR